MNDPTFIISAMRINSLIYNHIPSELRKNKIFMEHCQAYASKRWVLR